MTKKLFLVVAAILPLLFVAATISNVYATEKSDFFNEDGYILGHSKRPAINEDFDPDESCLFDAFQLKCITGANQQCPRPQFGNNEDYTCFPLTLVDGDWKWVCPQDYHTIEDDETGQCYPNEEDKREEGCPEWAVFEEAKGGRDLSDSCVEYKIQCEYNEDHVLCNGQERSDGIKVCDKPEHPGFKYCTKD